MEAARKNSGKEQKKYSNELKTAQENIRTAARSLKEAKKMVQTHKEERDTLSAEQQQLLKEKTKLELIIKDLSDEVLGDNTSKVSTSLCQAVYYVEVKLLTKFSFG
jgi:structural maintenance of chromosome 3 (chondroitin sulfate proteoglycan 6)